MLAPIVVFAYNRAEHLKNTLVSLEKCKLSEQSKLIVFSDGPKKDSAIAGVQEVRKFLQEYRENSLFLDVEVIEAKENKGLAKSIITGVGKVIEQYGKVIVVEDDVMVAPYFIQYMNESLEFFANDQQIFSIGGLTVPMPLPKTYPYDLIKTQRCSSVCWATWKDRWETIQWDMPDYGRFHFDFQSRRAFNRWGNDRSSMLDDQMNHRINSWAIRFDYAMWKNQQYNMIPRISLANHEGVDGSGTHAGPKDEQRNIINGKMWIDCDSIRMEAVPVMEEIRKEFCKCFDTKKSALLKRYISNLIYPLKNK